MVTVSISSLIYRSKAFADSLFESVHEFTPMVARGEAEFFFVANDPTDEVVAHLRSKGYPHHINVNPKRSREELFAMGYAAPEYIHSVYRGYNQAISLSTGEIVVLLNSDHCLSPDWLENLMKYLSSKTVVCSQLVERMHPNHGIFPRAYRGEFGSHPHNFRKQKFLAFAEEVKTTGIQVGGAYMPCAFRKDVASQVGFYPEGNIAGSSFNEVVATGDETFFRKLRERGVTHVTAMDSIVYHLKEGELDDNTGTDPVPASTEMPGVSAYEPPKGGTPLPVILTSENGRPYLTGDLPLVSVVTPAYNRAEYLIETIESVLSQDYPRIEYIVLDDGSTDNTLDVLKKYDERITRETHANMGETRTVNKGFEMTHGDIVVVVNSDDPLLPGAVSATVGFMQSNPDILVAYPDWNFIDAESKTTSHVQVREYDYEYMVSHHHCTPGPGAFIRRRAFQLTGMRDPDFKYVADFEYWLRLGLYGAFARIPRTLATFRVHGESASVAAKGRAMAEEHILLMRTFYSRPDLPGSIRKVRREAFCWAHLVAAVAAGRARVAVLDHLSKAMLHDPVAFTVALRWFVAPRLFSGVQTGGRLLPRPMRRPLGWVWRHSALPIARKGLRFLEAGDVR